MEKNIRIIPVSHYHFRRLFKAETGKTSQEYLEEKRMNYARQLLQSVKANTVSVKETALRVGYEDPYYFSRVFRKATGMCPREWNRERLAGRE